ncbi:MAG: single-stranded-DNA-specific exonuclease RecJ [Candidatus Omnitrophota bacterium]
MHKILNIAKPNPQLQKNLSEELKVSLILAQLLINRGIKSTSEAHKFIDVKLSNLLDPFDFLDMTKAVKRIKVAAQTKEKVMLFGDYDVDGVTSIALLKSALTSLGLEVVHYLPHRVKEGYGLNKNAIRMAKENKIGLLVTADCGTSNHEEIQELKRLHIDTIITDHHEPLNCEMPQALSIINPKVKNANYKFRDLAGVGVAYKFAQGITGDSLFEDLDLVSLGTIADVVPLTGENRIIAKEGLKRLSKTKRAGLKALMEVSGVKGKTINATFVSFILGPRLNASGRMDSAHTALELLLCEDEGAALNLAKSVDAHNRQRQKIESAILEEAQALIDKEVNFKEHKVIVLAKEDWHPGVLGIVASKIAARFYRPTIIISLTEKLCKGSARSIKNFHIFDALSGCKHLLEEFGGHAHAAGLVITKDSIQDFKETINRLACDKLRLEDLLPSTDIDMELKLSDLSERLAQELSVLEPYGTGNPEPLFYTRNLKLKGEPQVLGRNTLKFWVTDGELAYHTIGFGLSGLRNSFLQADSFDMVYTPAIDDWQGNNSIILEAKDVFFR